MKGTHEPWQVYLAGFLLPAIVIYGNLAGGWATGLGVVTVLGVFPLLDLFLGEDERPIEPNVIALEAIVYLRALASVLCLGTLFYRAYVDGPGLFSFLAAFSTGLSSGIVGFVTAHELFHAKAGIRKKLGIFLLGTVNYPHNDPEHIFQHHKNTASPTDNATARRDQSVWGFFITTVPKQYVSAWKICAKRSSSLFTNAMFRWGVLQVGFFLFLGLALSWWVAATWIIQSLITIFTAEYVNYIEHWGIERAEGSKISAKHSWDTEVRWSRWVLIALTRHADHHRVASRRFYELESQPDAPRLPSGYFATFFLAMIPPLWKRVMGPRLPPQPS